MVHELSMLPKLGATRIAALAVAALSLSACEDSVGLESAPKVASVSDLGSCTVENAGEAVFVEDERMLYTCGEEGWKVELEPAEYERTCGAGVVPDDSVSKCGEDGTFTDSRDGRVYKCVKIGDQVWMAENLDFGEQVHHYGTQIVASAAQAQKYCYGDDSTNCAKYGGLYQWNTAMGFCVEYAAMGASALVGKPHRGICPAGWHVPTQGEWERLVAFVQLTDSSAASKKLRSIEGWTDGNGVDAFGWSALPGGSLERQLAWGTTCTRYVVSVCCWNEAWSKLQGAAFWSAAEEDDEQAILVGIGLSDDVKMAAVRKISTASVRCVQD